MNAAHIHLILNHFPIAGILGAILILLVAAWCENKELSIAGMLLVVLTGIVTIPTYLSGEPAEKIIEHMPNISEKMIHIHEETAEKALWFIGASTLAALISLVLTIKRKRVPERAITTILIISIVAMGFIAWTNELGGEISHPEIRKLKTKGIEPFKQDQQDREDHD